MGLEVYLIVYLIGVHHQVQYVPPDIASFPESKEVLDSFVHLVSTEARDRGADLVAEEFSQHELTANRAIAGTVQTAAQRAGVRHLFADPDPNERARDGISTPEQRERVWLRRLKADGAERVIFVCGDGHIDSFRELLEASGAVVSILRTEVGKGWEFLR